jgi:hypothetical protein
MPAHRPQGGDNRASAPLKLQPTAGGCPVFNGTSIANENKPPLGEQFLAELNQQVAAVTCLIGLQHAMKLAHRTNVVNRKYEAI